MSQNGPYPGGSQPDSGYAVPTDPWNGQDTSWGAGQPAHPFEPSYAYQPPPVWQTPPPPRRRGPGTPIIVLVSLLGVLVVAGLAVTTYLVTRGDPADATATPVRSAAQPSVATQDTADARFVAAGQCVRNDGSEDVPQMRVTPCVKGAYEVLKRIDGATTGDKDAQVKCATVTGYTNWYFYDSELDGLDFVLCLRAR